MWKVPSIRTWLSGASTDDDFIDVHLDEEYMRQVYARLQTVADGLLLEPAKHQRWFRELSSLCSFS